MTGHANCRIFINYRRGDDWGATQALFARLEGAFKVENVFMDVEQMPAGENFVEVLKNQVAECDVFLALIGKNWLALSDKAGRRRLDNKQDFVRIEIEAAFALKKHVIPVLIGDTPIPREEELPESLRPLTVRHAVRLTHERFKPDCEGLIRSIGQAFVKIEARRAEEKKAAEVEAARRKAEEEARQQEAANVERERRRREAIAGLSPENIAKEEELANWRFIENLNSEEEYRDHIARFEGRQTARYALAKLEAAAWSKLETNGSETGFVAFLGEFPRGGHAAEALARLEALRRAAQVKKEAEAKLRLETDEWAKVASSYDIEKINAFIHKWPKGRYIGAARARVNELERASSRDNIVYRGPRVQPEEWFSAALAVFAAVVAQLAIRYANWNPATHAGLDWEPENHVLWAIPLWIGLFYFIIQIVFLLQSASQIRVLGALDSVIAFLPLLAGLVLLALNIADSATFYFSSFQLSALAVLIVVSGAEFLLTIWVRFVVNRRAIGLGGDY